MNAEPSENCRVAEGRLTRFSIFISAYFLAFVVSWTAACHICVLLGLSWNVLRIAGVVCLLVSPVFGRFLFGALSSEYTKSPLPAEEDIRASVGGLAYVWMFFVGVLGVALAPHYVGRYSVFVLVGAGLLFLKHRRRSSPTSLLRPPPPTVFRASVPVFAALLLSSAFLAVCVHRTDTDDCSFLQLAVTTLRNPGLPVYGFEESLGPLREGFRFLPYRLSSYELGAALLHSLTKVPMEVVYYSVLPAGSSMLGLVFAFLFARLFLNEPAAVASCVLLFLLLLAWGDSSLAYGNRVFVRLFQGKGLLVYHAAPLMALGSLLLARNPCRNMAVFVSAVMVYALGVSSSGLTCGFVGLAVALAASFMVIGFPAPHQLIWFFCPFVYHVFAGLVLWSQIPSGVHFSDIGTVAPIESSLGGALRQVSLFGLLLLLLLVGQFSSRVRGFAVFGFFSSVLLLNPWVSFLLAGVSAANFTWRMAWAYPAASLLSVGFVLLLEQAVFSVWYRVTALVMLVLFLLSGPWVLRPGNHIQIGGPSLGLPSDFDQTKRLLSHIHRQQSSPQLLLGNPLAAWVPLAAPGTALVMPGHMYPSMLATMLDAGEYSERRWLYDSLHNIHMLGPADLDRFAGLLRKYKVNVLVLREEIWTASHSLQDLVRLGVRLEATYVSEAYRVVHISPEQ